MFQFDTFCTYLVSSYSFVMGISAGFFVVLVVFPSVFDGLCFGVCDAFHGDQVQDAVSFFMKILPDLRLPWAGVGIFFFS